MGPLAGDSVIGALTSRLDSDEYVPVRAEAATGLGKIGGPAAMSALVAAQGREREQLVLTAIGKALGTLRAAERKPEVKPALNPPAKQGTRGSRH
jgi:HEAT repeat protein